MQTFLPYSDFIQTARCLDNKRLGKQRVETFQILNAQIGMSKGWVNHPATKMWKYHRNALVEYGIIICEYWISLGFKDSLLDKIKSHYDKTFSIVYPPWLGDEKFHNSHKSKLIQKNSDYYTQFGWNVLCLNYQWPSMINEKTYILVEGN